MDLIDTEEESLNYDELSLLQLVGLIVEYNDDKAWNTFLENSDIKEVAAKAYWNQAKQKIGIREIPILDFISYFNSQLFAKGILASLHEKYLQSKEKDEVYTSEDAFVKSYVSRCASNAYKDLLSELTGLTPKPIKIGDPFEDETEEEPKREYRGIDTVRYIDESDYDDESHLEESDEENIDYDGGRDYIPSHLRGDRDDADWRSHMEEQQNNSIDDDWSIPEDPGVSTDFEFNAGVIEDVFDQGFDIIEDYLMTLPFEKRIPVWLQFFVREYELPFDDILWLADINDCAASEIAEMIRDAVESNYSREFATSTQFIGDIMQENKNTVNVRCIRAIKALELYFGSEHD